MGDSTILKKMALSQMESEYRKLYKQGKVIIADNTLQMAKDIVANSPMSLMDTLGISVEDVQGVLNKVKDDK